MSTIESNKKDFSAKGTISNPYTEEEYQQLQAEGKDVACYVEGRGFCAPAAMAPPTNPGSPSDSSDSSNSETDPTAIRVAESDTFRHGDYIFSCLWYAKVKGNRQIDGSIYLSDLTLKIVPVGDKRTEQKQDGEGNWIDVDFISGGLPKIITKTGLSTGVSTTIPARLDCNERRKVGSESTTKDVVMDTSITLVPNVSPSGNLTLDIFGIPTASIIIE